MISKSRIDETLWKEKREWMAAKPKTNYILGIMRGLTIAQVLIGRLPNHSTFKSNRWREPWSGRKT
jgi:hypothetical protein